MSEDTFAKCVALELKEPIDQDEIYDMLCDYLDDLYGAYTFSIQFGNDFIAVYQNQKIDNHCGIVRVDHMTLEHRQIRNVLDSMCKNNNIAIYDQPKYFTDFWYDGVDCSVTGMDWKDL